MPSKIFNSRFVFLFHNFKLTFHRVELYEYKRPKLMPKCHEIGKSEPIEYEMYNKIRVSVRFFGFGLFFNTFRYGEHSFYINLF